MSTGASPDRALDSIRATGSPESVQGWWDPGRFYKPVQGVQGVFEARPVHPVPRIHHPGHRRRLAPEPPRQAQGTGAGRLPRLPRHRPPGPAPAHPGGLRQLPRRSSTASFRTRPAMASPAMCWPWSGRWTPSTSPTSPRPRCRPACSVTRWPPSATPAIPATASTRRRRAARRPASPATRAHPTRTTRPIFASAHGRLVPRRG